MTSKIEIKRIGDMNTKTISIELPETAFSALRKSPDEFAQEMRIAAAVKWYELGEISQGKAAEIAGLNRAEFIDVLSRYQVSPFQYTSQELAEEIASFARSRIVAL
jgi:predicted HTH domain antitoxin